MPLFVTQCFHGFKARSPVGGINTKEQTDCRGKDCRKQDRIQSNHGGKSCATRHGDPSDDEGDQPSKHDADDAADQAEQGRLGQKLDQNVPSPGPERLAQTDLARPLGNGDEHDVHDADAAHQQGNTRDTTEEDRKDPGDGLECG